MADQLQDDLFPSWDQGRGQGVTDKEPALRGAGALGCPLRSGRCFPFRTYLAQKPLLTGNMKHLQHGADPLGPAGSEPLHIGSSVPSSDQTLVPAAKCATPGDRRRVRATSGKACTLAALSPRSGARPRPSLVSHPVWIGSRSRHKSLHCS